MKNIQLDLQIAVKDDNIPTENDFFSWLNAAIKMAPLPKNKNELCIRIINEQESAELNKTYRHKQGATNILSFPYHDEDSLLGDLAICAPIIAKEAQQQNKLLLTHWAHIVIHGYLHLVGFDHQTTADANKMEQLEIEILQELGYPNPY